MAILTQHKVLNVIPGTTPQLTVHCSQGDVGSVVGFELYAGSTPFTPEDAAISVQGIRKDGTGFGPTACAYEENVVSMTIDEAMTSVPGPVVVELTITEESGTVSTANFAILVEAAAFPNGPLVDNSVDVYQQILQYVQSFPAGAAADATAKVAAEAALRQAADQALQASIDAEAAARVAAVSAEATARAAADTQLQTEISGLQNAVGGPNVALTAADFTDITKVYVVAGTIPGMTTGDWYYWDGTQWVSGGVYNSAAVQTDPTLSVAGMPADAAACGDVKSAVLKKATDAIIDHNNLLENVEAIPNAQNTNGTITASTSFDLYLVTLVAGTTYKFKGARFIYDGTSLIYNSGVTTVQDVTPTNTGLHYVTLMHSVPDAFMCTNANYTAGDYGTLAVPLYDSDTLAQAPGSSEKKPASQKMVTDAFADIPALNIDKVSIKDGTSIMPLATTTENKYAAGSVGNAISFTDSTSFDLYKLPAKAGTYYFSASARFARAVNTSEVITAAGDNATTLVCPEGTAFIYVTVAKASTSGFMVAYGAVPTATRYLFTDLYDVVAERVYGKGYERITGDLASGGSFTGKYTSVKKNNVYTFCGKITSFSSLLIGRGKAVNGGSYLEITGTNAIVHFYDGGDIAHTYAHGLTISDYIKVQIIVKVGKADITIFSNGGSYAITNETWSGDAYAPAFVESVGSALTGCTFTWSSGDFRKAVWAFGDSYFGMTSDARWCYYLAQDGFIDNVLLNAYGGESSNYAWRELKQMLEAFGRPEFVVWCMGMNDGSDTNEDTPSTDWKTGYDQLLHFCEVYGLTPILATIPSVPSISHEGKNKMVRESGYRYIDFASAVGASSAGVWYAGMLSSDNVHPTASGAKALYYQAMADVPELTFSNP